MPSRREKPNATAARPVDEEVCNCTLLRKAARRVSMVYDHALAASGLRITQYAILAELGRSAPLTITQLANAMVMDRNGLGHNLRPLERDGLVRMEPGHDRRSRVIVMTETGRQRFAAAKPLWRRAQKQFALAFAAEEIDGLQALLSAAVAADHGDATASR